MASALANGNHSERCRDCNCFVSKEPLPDGRIRYQCKRCGPQLEYRKRSDKR